MKLGASESQAIFSHLTSSWPKISLMTNQSTILTDDVVKLVVPLNLVEQKFHRPNSGPNVEICVKK